ncbi:MAG: PEP-utilizing enzyme [Candidatus Woesearchaeota archaeon]|nr:PEP-utilizing enzyme [Candidatus Woesearchaeota archaeon]
MKTTHELKEYIKKNVWYKQAGNIKARYIFIPCRAAANHMNTKISIWFVKDGKHLEWLCPRQDFTNKALATIESQKKDPAFIDKEMKKAEEKSALLTAFYEEYRKKDSSHLNLKEALSAVKKLEQLNYDYWLHAYLCDTFDPEGDELLKKEIRQHNVKLDEDTVSVFMRSNWLNFMQEEKQAFLKIAQKVQQKKISLTKAEPLLERHAETYFYVDNSWELTKVLTEKEFMARLNEILKQDEKEIETEIRYLETDWGKKQEELIKKYGIPKSLVTVLYLFRNLFMLRDKRKKHSLINNHFYDMFFSRIAEILGIPLGEVVTILAEDINKKTTAGDIRKKIRERKEFFLEEYTSKKTTWYAGKEAEGIVEELQKTFANHGEIKGTTACPGKAQGIVRIIKGEAHFSKFNEHEILVAPMTRPEYVPLMKKAAAIVTDEGGVTCHAALISRELKVPCIVGTQIATRRLHDGELVEVDADKGIVRVIR